MKLGYAIEYIRQKRDIPINNLSKAFYLDRLTIVLLTMKRDCHCQNL